MDKMCHAYTVRRKCNRWAVVMFQHILDMVVLNAYVTWAEMTPSWKSSHQRRASKEFIYSLADELVRLFIGVTLTEIR